MKAHQRHIIDYIREEWGVSASLHHGGKHPYLVVNGHRITMPSSPSDHRTLANAESQIRATLGPPLLSPSNKIKRSLENMMPEMPFMARSDEPKPVVEHERKTSAMTYLATVAVYRETSGRPRLNLRAPAEVASRFPGGMSVHRLDDETFEFRPDRTAQTKFRFDGRKRRTANIGGRVDWATSNYGASPAEVTEVDDVLLVVCPLATRVPTGARPGRRNLQATPAPVTPVAAVPRVPHTVLAAPTRDFMTGVLLGLADIEGHGWRLVKVNGAWRFRMDDVSLDAPE